MPLEHPTAVTAVVAIRQPELARSLLAALEQLRFLHCLASVVELGWTVEEPAIIYCLSATEAEDLARLPGPAVLVGSLACAGGAEKADLPVGSAPLATSDLTPVSLLRALIVAALGTNADFVARRLAQLEMFSRVPPELIHAFVRDPSGMTRLWDLRRCMKLSRRRAQKVARLTGRFDRAEHLLTALRCASWAELMHRGLHRGAVECYLGIEDRSDFRRACERRRRRGSARRHQLGCVLRLTPQHLHTTVRSDSSGWRFQFPL